MTSANFSIILNVGSIVLGVFAWLMAIWGMKKARGWKTACSYLFCAAALLLQLFEVNHRVHMGDFAAVEDTIDVVVFMSVVLIGVTVILNLVAYFKSRSAQR